MTLQTVFFYGLFMDESWLCEQGLVAQNCRRARLDGYGLRIGARATLEKSSAEQVHGVLMSLAEEDLHRLYSQPSVVDYVAEQVVATLADDSELEALCYILPIASCQGRNRDYALALANVARKSGLPDDYVLQIESWAE